MFKESQNNNSLLNIKQALKLGISKLSACNVNNPSLEVELLLENSANIPREKFPLEYERKLSNLKLQKFLNSIKKRIKNVPLQYIIGYATFRQLELYIEEGVLIPRPETEMLVENAIKILKKHTQNETNKFLKNEINILDVGCGSGCIACSLAYEIQRAKITATDINPKALKITKVNIKKYKLEDKIKLFKADIFPPNKTRYDLIISNPPYIPFNVFKNLDVEIKNHEPTDALLSGTDGLDFFRKFIKHAPLYLKNSGIIALELFENNLEIAKKITKKNKFKNIIIKKDLNNKNRFLLAIKK